MADDDTTIPAFLRRDAKTDSAHQRRLEREKRSGKSSEGVALAPAAAVKNKEKKRDVAVRESRASVVRRVLDEVSKKTLGNYIKKAHVDRANTISNASDYEREAERGNTGDDEEEEQRTLKNYDRNINNRTKYIAKAVDRLTKEDVEQIDELSPQTLGDYIKGSRSDLKGMRRGDGGPTPGERSHNFKRQRGLERATDKLVRKATQKEDVNEATTLSDARAAAEHHFAMYKYHHHMGTFAERQAMHHMGTKHETPWQSKADRHYKKADHHDRKMNAAHGVLTNAERYDESADDHYDDSMVEGYYKNKDIERKEREWAKEDDEKAGKKKANKPKMDSEQGYPRRADEDVLDEGRGRPRKSGGDVEDPDEHPIMQLKKSIALRGQHMFKFKNGETKQVAPDVAHRVLDKYSSIDHPEKRAQFASRVAHSSKELGRVVRECEELDEDASN